MMVNLYSQKIMDSLKECDIGGQLYTSKYSLISHQKMHTGDLHLVCDISGKYFSRKSQLKKHSVVHSSLKPFV